MDLEIAALSLIIVDRALEQGIKSGINIGLFHDPLNRSVFSWLLEQYLEKNDYASLDLVKHEFPEFKVVEVQDSIDLIVDRMKDRALYVELQQSLKEIVASTKIGATEGLNKLQEVSSRLSVNYSKSVDTRVSDAVGDVLDMYERARELEGVLGISWPWDVMTKTTKGIRGGDFIGMYGPPGTLKTWVLIVLAEHVQKLGIPVVFFTYEMTNAAVMYRYAAYRARVDYEAFQVGELDADEESRLYETIDAISRDSVPFVIARIEEKGAQALAAIKAKLLEYKAGLCLIDGLSYLPTSLRWESVAEAIMGLNDVAKSTDIPVIITHHTNDKALKYSKSTNDASDVALGRALHRHTDALIRFIMEPKQEEDNELILTFRKHREGRRVTFAIHAKPAVDFGQKYVQDSESVDFGEE
jgi:replicative DNA helicase